MGSGGVGLAVALGDALIDPILDLRFQPPTRLFAERNRARKRSRLHPLINRGMFQPGQLFNFGEAHDAPHNHLPNRKPHDCGNARKMAGGPAVTKGGYKF